MIHILNKHRPRAGTEPEFYVGRPGLLGNPYQIGRDGDRAGCIRLYRDWLRERLKDNVMITRAFLAIKEAAAQGDIALVCWCAPKACHAEVIKEFIESSVA